MLIASPTATAGPGEYLSSGTEGKGVIFTTWHQPSPLGSDSHDAYIASMTVVLDEVEGRLFSWLRNPDAFADDETDAPSIKATWNAIRHVNDLKASLAHLSKNVQYIPLRAATIGSGGSINLEFERMGDAWTHSFKPDGSAEQLFFSDGRLRLRIPLNSSRG